MIATAEERKPTLAEGGPDAAIPCQPIEPWLGGSDHLEWWVIPLSGGDMLRVNVFQFYRLGHNVHRLGEIPEKTSTGEIFQLTLYVADELRRLLGQRIIFLPTVPTAAADLRRAISELIPPDWLEDEDFDMKAPLSASALSKLRNAVTSFEAVLSAELARADIYSVLKKGIYDTTDLIDRADEALPEKARAILPDQARQDILQCGRCLAFEIPTAAGFHILRALESVIKKYYEVLAKKAWPHAQRDWGKYIDELKKLSAPDKVTAALDQIRKNYRNPLLHPEDDLDLNQAIGLFGLVQGALSLVLEEISAALPPAAVPP